MLTDWLIIIIIIIIVITIIIIINNNKNRVSNNKNELSFLCHNKQEKSAETYINGIDK